MDGHMNEIVVLILLGVAIAVTIATVFGRRRNAADNARLKGYIDQQGDEVARLRAEVDKLRDELAIIRGEGSQRSGAATETRIKEP